MSRGAFDYVTVGHITVDVLLDAPAAAGAVASTREGSATHEPHSRASGLRQPGGGAFYSALQAARLGLRTLIVTRGVPAEIEALLAPYTRELTVEVEPAPRTTTLLTRCGGGGRTQRVLAWAGALRDLVGVDTEILHLAPVARETPAAWAGRAHFVGLTPQGLARRWGAGGEMLPAELVRERVPARCDAVVYSAQERERCTELASLCGEPIVAVTAGAGATELLGAAGAPVYVPACPVARTREDLGAGDVFAAAFFVALAEGLDPARAAAFGNAAAAVRIVGAGPQAVGGRDAIERCLSGLRRGPTTR